MTQYHIEKHTIILKVKKSPLLIRAFMFLITFVFFTIPFVSMMITILMQDRFHIGFVVGIIFFGLLGFFMLRISLWNTFGKETIVFDNPEIIYEADYKWFKDGKKSYNINPPYFSIEMIGYKEDQIGALLISDGDENELIESVVKIPIDQLEALIEILKKEFN